MQALAAFGEEFLVETGRVVPEHQTLGDEAAEVLLSTDVDGVAVDVGVRVEVHLRLVHPEEAVGVVKRVGLWVVRVVVLTAETVGAVVASLRPWAVDVSTALEASAGRKNHGQDRAEAMIAAFEHNPDGVIAALQSAIQRGLRDSQVFDDPIFEDLWDEPRFVALQQQLDAILAVEHDKVLQLICFNNPVPGEWQPMTETCEGVDNLQE